MLLTYVYTHIMRHSSAPINPKPLIKMAFFCRQFPLPLNSSRNCCYEKLNKT